MILTAVGVSMVLPAFIPTEQGSAYSAAVPQSAEHAGSPSSAVLSSITAK